MNKQSALRILVAADVLSMVAGVIAGVLLGDRLPPPLHTYVSTRELHPALTVVALALLALKVAAWIGLWRRASWAPTLYAVTWIVCVVVVPFGGPYVGSGAEELFDFVSASAAGAILALLFVPTQERSSGTPVV